MSTQSAEGWPYKYVAVLRCRTWGHWPVDGRVKSSTLTFGMPDSATSSLALTVHLATYENRPRPENSPSLACKNAISPLLWRGAPETGFWLGERVLKAPEDALKVQWKSEAPHQGDVDVQLHIGSKVEVARIELNQLAFDLSTCVVGYVNLALGEHLVPVAPLQLFELKDGVLKTESTAMLFVTSRPTIDELAMHRSLDGFVRFWRTSTPAEERAVSAAMRRYLSAANEADPLDKFCDLWEACEFATAGIKAPGKVVGRIAQALAAHLMPRPQPSDKTRIERVLGIKELHQIRGAIVHEAEESPAHLHEKTALLEQIAVELLRYRTGLPYRQNQSIDELLTEAAQS